MKIKTEFIGKDCGYFVVRDETSLYNDIFNYDGGQQAVDEYFIEGKFSSHDSNGYAIGVLESISQSDHCPPYLYTEEYEIIITILQKELPTNTLYAIHVDNELYIPQTGMGIVNQGRTSNGKKISKLYHSTRNALIAAKNIHTDLSRIDIVPYGPIGEPIKIKKETD